MLTEVVVAWEMGRKNQDVSVFWLILKVASKKEVLL